MSGPISIKSPGEIAAMREVCKLAARTLKMVREIIKPGISTEDINAAVHEFTLAHGAIPAPLNYGGDPSHGIPPFPKSVCTSINEVVCHGIPSKREVLKSGDIVNVDVTPLLEGFHGDTSMTFLVGEVSAEVRQLVETTKQCLDLGIAQVRADARIRDIGAAIQKHAEARGYGVVREYVGHGIGRIFHEAPQVPHYAAKGPNPRLRPGMIFTIEPMINLGSFQTVLDNRDGWTVRTADGKPSAQFEHTVLVTDHGVDVLTDWKYIES